MAGPSGFEPEPQAPQACVLSRLDYGPDLIMRGKSNKTHTKRLSNPQ